MVFFLRIRIMEKGKVKTYIIQNKEYYEAINAKFFHFQAE